MQASDIQLFDVRFVKYAKVLLGGAWTCSASGSKRTNKNIACAECTLTMYACMVLYPQDHQQLMAALFATPECQQGKPLYHPSGKLMLHLGLCNSCQTCMRFNT